MKLEEETQMMVFHSICILFGITNEKDERFLVTCTKTKASVDTSNHSWGGLD